MARAAVPSTRDDLQDDDSEAVHVGLGGDVAAVRVLLRHVPAAYIRAPISFLTLVSEIANSSFRENMTEMYWSIYTYRVPAARLVTSLDWSPWNARANPKSEILGFMFSSSKTLLGLRSRWMTLRRDSSWRYSRPRAIPEMIVCRLLQSRPCRRRRPLPLSACAP